eukprot:gene5547-992_t
MPGLGAQPCLQALGTTYLRLGVSHFHIFSRLLGVITATCRASPLPPLGQLFACCVQPPAALNPATLLPCYPATLPLPPCPCHPAPARATAPVRPTQPFFLPRDNSVNIGKYVAEEDCVPDDAPPAKGKYLCTGPVHPVWTETEADNVGDIQAT